MPCKCNIFYWIPLDLIERSAFPLPLSSLKEEVETKALFFLRWQNFRMVSLSCSVTHSICKVLLQEPRKARSERNRSRADSPVKCRSEAQATGQPPCSTTSFTGGPPGLLLSPPRIRTHTGTPGRPAGPPQGSRAFLRPDHFWSNTVLF